MFKVKYFPLFALFPICLIFLYGKFIESRWIKVKDTKIEISGTDSNKFDIRIVHLTDFHLGSDVSLDYLRSVFHQAVNQKPDLICLTGDYKTSGLIKNKAEYIDAIKILTAAAPTYACPGNHDGGLWARERGGTPNVDEIKFVLESAGVLFLENATSKIKIRKANIIIGGLGDIWADRCEPEKIEKDLDTSNVNLKIILTHNPDSKIQTKKLKWDLILAGHTHGGQLYIPLIGAPFAPIQDKKFVNGLYEYNGGKIYVSPGIGNLHGMRINCRPEISILDVKN